MAAEVLLFLRSNKSNRLPGSWSLIFRGSLTAGLALRQGVVKKSHICALMSGHLSMCKTERGIFKLAALYSPYPQNIYTGRPNLQFQSHVREENGHLLTENQLYISILAQKNPGSVHHCSFWKNQKQLVWRAKEKQRWLIRFLPKRKIRPSPF